jgi:hypothetical protein
VSSDRRLGAPALLGLFAIGAAASLVGDQGHVASGATRYLDHGVPFIWESALWFPLMVGAGTVALAAVRLRLAPARSDLGLREAAAGIAAVSAIYAVTALVRDEPLGPATALVFALASLVTARFADDRSALVCGLLAVVAGTTTEIVMSAAGVFEYAHDIDPLAGVPPWLPALYFSFGVVSARLGEVFSR